MAEKSTEPAKTGDAKSASGITVGDLRGLITEIVTSVIPKSGEPAKTTEPAKMGEAAATAGAPADIAEQVRQQVARLKEQEERTRKDQETDSTIKALLEKTAEKPPIERRRIHKFMKWGDND